MNSKPNYEAVYINLPLLPASFKESYYAALRHEIEQFAHDATAQKNISSFFIDGQPLLYRLDCLLDTQGILIDMSVDEVEVTIVIDKPLLGMQFPVLQHQQNSRLNIVLRETMNNSWAEFIRVVQKHVPNLAVDLFIGQEGCTELAWQQQMAFLIEQGFKHISLYFDERVEERLGAERAADWYLWTAEMLGEKGFEQYSTYDFALQGYASRQQKIYASYKAYRGFGLGAVTFSGVADGACRIQTTQDVALYCLAPLDGASRYTRECISATQAHFERCMMALTGAGVAISEVEDGQTVAWRQHFEELRAKLCMQGYAREAEGIFSLTASGHVRENEIIRKIWA